MSVCEPVCDPCPKYCRRVAKAYIGHMGWAGYIVEAVVVVVMSLMVIGVGVPQDWRIVLALLVIAILLDLIFWIINLLRYAPCFSLQTLPSLCDPCGCVLIVKGDPCDYATRVDHDIRQSNDDGHLRTSIIAGLWVFLMFGIFVGKYGTSGFDTPTQADSRAAALLFGIAKAIQVFVVIAFTFGMRYLLENHSDLMYRHFTAIPEIYRVDGCEVTRYGNKQNTPTGNRRNPLNGF